MVNLHVAAAESNRSQQSFMFYLAKTPFNNLNTPLQVFKLSSQVKQSIWLDGISVLYGKYQASAGLSDTEWYAVGPYWQLWSSDYGALALEFAPTYLSQRYMAGHFVGSNWHFTSALEYTLPIMAEQQFSVGLRYQHTSNAGIDSPNPGIDGIGAFVRFTW